MADIPNSDRNKIKEDDFDKSIDIMMSRHKSQNAAAARHGAVNVQSQNFSNAQQPSGRRGLYKNGQNFPGKSGLGEHPGSEVLRPGEKIGNDRNKTPNRPYHNGQGSVNSPAANGTRGETGHANSARRPEYGENSNRGKALRGTPHPGQQTDEQGHAAGRHNRSEKAAENVGAPSLPVKSNNRKKKPTDDMASTRTTESAKAAELKSGKKGSASSGKNSGKNSGEKDVGGNLVIGMLRALVYLVVVTVVAAFISIFIINVGNDVFAFVKSDEIIDVTVPENATSDDIADILYENGIIKYKSVFRFYGKLKDIDDSYVAGEYSVTPMMNYETLYYEFKEKPVSGTSWITIPEGYTTDEIINLMVSYGIGTKENYVDVINNYDFDYWFVDELEESGWDENRFYRLDGYLFPDTYEFYNASSEVTVIGKLLARFDEVYTEAYKARAAELNMTTDRVVIIASMIEKEAGQSSDYRNVSSVFYNRLNNAGKFPKLESDATVVYAIQHDTGERPKEVTGETIQYQSPYNTYTNDGLPPGSICNPGMNALKYSLYPADTNYFYFVSSGSGVTLFATTNAEHESNKAKIKG